METQKILKKPIALLFIGVIVGLMVGLIVLGWGNVHVSPTGEMVMFDFDFCGPGWRGYDVATYLSGEPTETAAVFSMRVHGRCPLHLFFARSIYNAYS